MTTPDDESDQMRLRRLQALAHVMDDSIPVPILNKRIGVDSVIGLVPIAGDLIGGAISAFILYNGYRLGASLATLLRMLGNVLLETVVGAVPIVGDLFDMGFKANLRNVRLLVEHAEDTQRVERHSLLWTVLVFGGAVVLIAGAIALTIFVAVRAISALIGLF